MEIERKWLVDKTKISELILKDDFLSRKNLKQYYLNSIDDTWLVRLRKEDSQYFLTLKSKGLLSREELEFEIEVSEFNNAIRHAKTSLTKIRYTLSADPSETLYYQVDVYFDYDFITCEVEFNSEEDANAFKPPNWCMKDVTNDPKYKNVNLAK